jgi:hypothetical protein
VGDGILGVRGNGNFCLKVIKVEEVGVDLSG